MGNRQLQEIRNLLSRLDAAVVVREPGSARSAEAFEGLRKQLNLAVKSHRSHVGHLVSLSDSLDRNADIELIRDRVNDFLQELGIKTIREFIPQLFEVVETVDGDEDGYEIIEPAIVEELEDRGLSPIRLGKVRVIKGPIPEPIPDIISPEIEQISDEIETQSVAPSPTVGQVLLAIGSVVIGLLLGWVLFHPDGNSVDKPTESTVALNSESSTSSSLLSVSTTLPTTTTTGK
jgi:hypothetical protein